MQFGATIRAASKSGWFATHADRGELTGTPMLGELDNLGDYVESRSVDLVWLALPMRDQPKISYALSLLRHLRR